MSQPPDDAKICPLFYQLPPAKIVVIKSLLESYEFIGELRTLDADAGVVVVLALESSVQLVRNIIKAEPALVDAREIDAPKEGDLKLIAGDWLLSELYEENAAAKIADKE